MITLTGFDVPSFEYLWGIFAPIFEDYLPFIDWDCKIIAKVRTCQP
jgi:hypothetical protein